MKKIILTALVLLLTASLFLACDSPKNSDSYSSNESSVIEHTYKDFSPSEKQLFIKYIGEVIPFIANDEYYVEGYYELDDYENGINYYTFGNTEAEFESYRLKFIGYTFADSYEDFAGDAWYVYQKNAITIEMAYYIQDGISCVNLFISVSGGASSGNSGDSSANSGNNGDSSSGGGNSSVGGGSSSGEGGEDSTHTYLDFSADEKQLFIEYFGEVIPFIANDEYYVEEFELEDGTPCLSYYTAGNTQAEFNAYRAEFSDYTFIESYIDSYGDTCYVYQKGEIEVNISYYYYEGYDIVDVYVYFADDSINNGGNNSGSEGGEVNTPVEGALLACFEFGSNGSASHKDGSDELGSSKTYTENGYSLVISNASKVYPNSYDAKGNSCLKVGSSKTIGSFEISVPAGVNSVVFNIAQYKANTSKVVINGTTYTITTASNNGEYTAIIVNTTSTKKITVSTVEGALRVMINNISFYSSSDGSGSGGNSGSGSGENNSGNQGGGAHLYNDFTSAEKELFIEYFGESIPFVANSDYIVEEYTYDYEEEGVYEEGINFYTYGNTQAEFEAYLVKLDKFVLDETSIDSYGDTWYLYSADGYYLDVAYYYGEGGYIIDVYAYCVYEGSSGNASGSGSANEDIMSNAGAGLPSGANGVYTVDFTKGKYVENVTGLGTYIGGCPTTSINKNPAVLVIPVEFSDVTASSKGYTVNKIEKAFNGGVGETDYYSVHDYFYLSSYGQLDLEITVLNYWFRPSKSSSYYINLCESNSQGIPDLGVQIIIDEFLASVEGSMDLSAFDSDGNTIIDAIVLINTLEINSEIDMNWAYRYWNYYTDDDNFYYEYDGVSVNDYLWASYQFLFEGYDEEGYVSFDHVNSLNTFTYIHEFSHILGAEDYYDCTGKNGPMYGCDMMDTLCGDHSAFTKFNYGWLTTSRLITAESTVTVQLEAFAKAGDTIIIANDWDENLGLYQEYYIVAYYTNEGLNAGENAGFFSRDGIVVYHVNASLYTYEINGTTYYDVYNTNTDPSDSYGTVDNLIEFVKSPADTFTYIVGDSLSANVTNDNGAKIAYTFTVDALENGVATLTFTKND